MFVLFDIFPSRIGAAKSVFVALYFRFDLTHFPFFQVLRDIENFSYFVYQFILTLTRSEDFLRHLLSIQINVKF